MLSPAEHLCTKPCLRLRGDGAIESTGMAIITQEYLKSILHYDPETGVFTRLSDKTGRFGVGSRVGSISDHGYLKTSISGKEYYLHRLAFLFMLGEIPKHEIDHINMSRDDNRWYNLRQATRSENGMNKKAQSNNKSGVKGIFFDRRRNRWVAKIGKNGSKKEIGAFVTKEEAQLAYHNASKEDHGEYGRVA